MFLMSDLNPNGLLFQSSRIGFLPGVKKALEMGANVDINNHYASQVASFYGHYDIVELLLKNGANIHIMKSCAKQSPRDNYIKIMKILKKNAEK